MDAELTRLREETAALRAEEKDLRAALREGGSQVPLPELRASVTQLEQERSEMAARLAKLKSGNLKPVSVEEREQVNADHRKWQRTANARKKICKELWAEITDYVGKDKMEETREALGLEF